MCRASEASARENFRGPGARNPLGNPTEREKKSAPAARQPADAYRRMLAPAEASLCKCLAKLAGASLYAYRANAYKRGLPVACFYYYYY